MTIRLRSNDLIQTSVADSDYYCPTCREYFARYLDVDVDSEQGPLRFECPEGHTWEAGSYVIVHAEVPDPVPQTTEESRLTHSEAP